MLSFATLVIALGVSPVALIVHARHGSREERHCARGRSPARAAAPADTTLASSLASPLFQPVTLTALDTVRHRRRTRSR